MQNIFDYDLSRSVNLKDIGGIEIWQSSGRQYIKVTVVYRCQVINRLGK